MCMEEGVEVNFGGCENRIKYMIRGRGRREFRRSAKTIQHSDLEFHVYVYRRKEPRWIPTECEDGAT